MKAGLEIHQRLDTGKLFCRCPSEEGEGEPVIIKRRLRPVSGELGEKDRAALFEFYKGKEFRYQYFKNCCCLVELDEEPPHEPDKDALNTAIEIALLLNCKIVDEFHVMRKIVTDGSNVSGFQRTGLIGYGGYIEVDGKRIEIPEVYLEEESAGIVEDGDDYRVYRLDRLGIPLVEIKTGIIEDTPEFIGKVAKKIGLLLRATGKVKRGIGTIRQDINISIPGGARVEIKGCQDLSLIPKLVKFEIERQKNLLNIPAYEGSVRIYDVTEYFSKTRSKLFQKALSRGDSVLCMILRNYAGILSRKITPTKTFGKEVSAYGKPFITGIIHTDEPIERYGILDEINIIKQHFEVSENDVIVLSFGNKEDVEKGLRAIYERLCFEGVPEETRRALEDGNTEFMRPLPGSSRMYPETDIPPVPIDPSLVSKIKSSLPEDPEKRIHELVMEFGIPEDVAEMIVLSPYISVFRKFYKKINPGFLANLLTGGIRTLRRKGYSVDNIDSLLEKVLNLLSSGTIPKEAVLEIFEDVLSGQDFDSSVKKHKISVDENVLLKEIREAISSFKGDKKHMFKAVMGVLMRKYRGRISGEYLSHLVRGEIDSYTKD